MDEATLRAIVKELVDLFLFTRSKLTTTLSVPAIQTIFGQLLHLRCQIEGKQFHILGGWVGVVCLIKNSLMK